MRVISKNKISDKKVSFEQRGLMTPFLKLGAITYIEKITQFTNYEYYNEIMIHLTENENRFLEEVSKNNAWKLIINFVNYYYKKSDSKEDIVNFLESLTENEFLHSIFPYHNELDLSDIKVKIYDEEFRKYTRKLFSNHPYYPSCLKFIYSNNIGCLRRMIKEYIMCALSIFPEYDYEYKRRELNISQINDNFTRDVVERYTYIEKDIIVIEDDSYSPFILESQDYDTVYIFIPKRKRENLIDPELLNVLKCISDKNKLEILIYIQQGENSLKLLSQLINNSKSTIHHHINILKENNIIIQENNIYFINYEHINKTLRIIERILSDEKNI
ncbi:ArsR family transcriptional regulator (plasmid) [Macrococcoides bohemicum]|uniref:ArsR family transcriptional regulator n=1 Tax=Macrococcoides bohemicum TaxID=1903056 RepID=UPI003AFF62FC